MRVLLPTPRGPEIATIVPIASTLRQISVTAVIAHQCLFGNIRIYASTIVIYLQSYSITIGVVFTVPSLEEPFIAEGIEIASYLGEPQLADTVTSIIRGFHERGIIAHGIKRATHLGDVAVNGVLNNCPDNGRMESFWTSGSRVFLSEGTPYNPMRTFDTTFFHYSGGGIALTSFELLQKLGILPRGRSEHATITIAQPVPADVIELLLTACFDAGQSDSVKEARQRRQLVERSLIKELARIAAEGVSPGVTHEAQLDS